MTKESIFAGSIFKLKLFSKMKKTFLTFLLLGIFSLLHAQTASYKIEGNKNLLIDAYVINEGILLSTKTMFSNETLHFISNNAQKKWEIELEKSNNSTKKFFITSPSNNTIYLVKIPVSGLERRKHTITKINTDGSNNTFTIKFDETVGKNLQSVFCDDTNLYYLTTDNGDERHDKRKTSEKLILNKFDGNTSAHKRIELKLPSVVAGENTTFWSYIGRTQSGKHVVISKVIDYEANLNKISLATFNEEGIILEMNQFDIKLANKFTRPSLVCKDSFVTPKAMEEFHNEEDMDEVIINKSNTNGSQNQVYTNLIYTNPTYGGFVHIQLDPYSEAVYIFGLYGPERFKKVAANYDGLYLYKYSLNGTPLWKIQEDAPKELIAEKRFKVNGLPRERHLGLYFDMEKNTHLALDFLDKEFDFEISKEGKLMKINKSDTDNRYKNSMVTNATVEEYNKGKNNSYYPWIHSSGTSFLEIKDNNEIVVTYFKN